MLLLRRSLQVLFLLLTERATALATQSSSEPRVIVVGGGVGGLATAARLSNAANVLVLEKNAQVGGRCGSFDVNLKGKGTFRHERGPSLLLLKDVYLDLFTDCSQKKAQDYGLRIQQCVPAYQVVFDDGDTIDLGFPTTATTSSSAEAKLAESASRLQMDRYEPNGATKWDEYLNIMSAYLDCGLPNFIEERFDAPSFPSFLYNALRDNAKAWPLKPHSDVLGELFRSTKLKALASFQNLYVGLEPYRNDNQLGGGILRKTAPAVFGLLAAIELHPSNAKSGVYAPVGGFATVSKAIEKLVMENGGVEIRCNTTVTKICDNGVYIETASGEKEFVPSEFVVCNADLPYATESLLRDEEDYKQVYDWNDKFDYASGVIAFHWSIDCSLTKLRTHNVFLAGARSPQDAQDSWRVLRDEAVTVGETLEPFNFYVHRASHTDPSAAPDGCDSIMVLVPCPSLERDAECADMSRDDALRQYDHQFDNERIATVRKAVITRLQTLDPNFSESNILDQVVDTPATYARDYNVAAGTPFALSHGLSQLSLMRPGARSGKGNWFVGASSRPGNGVPLVLLGAKLVSDRILRKLKLASTNASSE